MNKFWAVWKETGGCPPNKRHESQDSAVKEAVRLCKKEGEKYYILEAIGAVAPVDIPTQYIKLQDDYRDF